jgi:D-glycero-beta-D-manno-heptose 1-phosphate adenylyltransferase
MSMRSAQSKILSRENARAEVTKCKSQGQRVVLANGCFDTLHVGHVRYLSGAKCEGDILIVAVNADSSVRGLKGPGRPILGEQARAQLVASLRDVDYVLIFAEPNVEALLEELRPDVHAKGTDYTAESVPERAVSDRLGIRVAIVGDPKDHSTRTFLDAIRKGPHG